MAREALDTLVCARAPYPDSSGCSRCAEESTLVRVQANGGHVVVAATLTGRHLAAYVAA